MLTKLNKTKLNYKRQFTIPTEIIEYAIPISAILCPLFTSAFVYDRYHISKPNQYLVKTGLGIKDVHISKQGLQYPFQTARFIDMNPINYSFELHAMSSEKMEFVLPSVFTIGPKDDVESLKKYVKLLSNADLTLLIKGILEGETRIQSAQMTIEQIFCDRKTFKEILINEVQSELDQFGLMIYNANIKELQDAVGSEYFEFIRQKKRSEAENISKVNIAEANKNGNIGSKEREALTRQQVANYEAQTILQENERLQEIEKSKAYLEIVKAQMKQQTEIANIEAKNASLSRDTELQMNVEKLRIAMEIEKLRASQFTQAQVQAEIDIKIAEGKAKAIELEASAKLYAKEKEASGILAVYNAQSEGVSNLIKSCQSKDVFLQYLMLDNGLYEKLANANALAIRGLQPKITTWNTSNNSNNPITDIMKNLPPLVSTIYDQTGIKPPTWVMDASQINKE